MQSRRPATKAIAAQNQNLHRRRFLLSFRPD